MADRLIVGDRYRPCVQDCSAGAPEQAWMRSAPVHELLHDDQCRLEVHDVVSGISAHSAVHNQLDRIHRCAMADRPLEDDAIFVIYRADVDMVGAASATDRHVRTAVVSDGHLGVPTLVQGTERRDDIPERRGRHHN